MDLSWNHSFKKHRKAPSSFNLHKDGFQALKTQKGARVLDGIRSQEVEAANEVVGVSAP